MEANLCSYIWKHKVEPLSQFDTILPCLHCWGTENTADLVDLVSIVHSREERRSHHQFRHDTARSPHIHRRTVMLRVKKDLRGTIPLSYQSQ